jgi:hypothetical protein
MNVSQLGCQDLYGMCLRGDESAWAYIYNYVLTIARSPRFRLREAPEDMAQSIVCHLLEKGIDRLHDHRAFRGYVRRVSINLILDSLKRKIPYTMSLDIPPGGDRASLPDPVSDNPGPEDMTLGLISCAPYAKRWTICRKNAGSCSITTSTIKWASTKATRPWPPKSAKASAPSLRKSNAVWMFSGRPDRSGPGSKPNAWLAKPANVRNP